jgi:hypothetical protein
MRRLLSLLCFVVFLGVALPAQAQMRQDVAEGRAPAKLYEAGGSSFSLNKLFSPAHFRMAHSYELSFGSFGGQGSSLGMYTNTMMWQFNQKLAARVDIAFAHSPFGGSAFGLGDRGDKGQLFLRNAEIAYRPTENMQLHFSVQQSPYGSYMGPYGYYNPYGYGYSGFQARYGADPRDLFWNDHRR